LILEGFGAEAQLKLLQAKVLLVGAGGLGSPAALYLAAAGVGTIGVVDGDTVSVSNLQRQVLHTTPDEGRPKVDVARERLTALNPDVNVRTYELFLNEANAPALMEGYDFVIDATDNFDTKYIVNDACVKQGKAFTMGGISAYSGQLMTHVPGTACYRCLFPEPPAPDEVETCAQVGVLGPVAGILGTVQATECLKYLTGVGQLLTNTLLTFDALTMQWHRFEIKRNADCRICKTK